MTEDKASRHCHMAFISLALGIFVLVGSAVIAGTLLSTAVNNKISADELEEALSTYEDLGNIMFALGDELVSSVDVTSDGDLDVGNMVVAQKITNKAFSKVEDNLLYRSIKGLDDIIEEIEDRKEMIREFIAWNEPLLAIKSYIDLSQWISKSCLEMDYTNSLRFQVATYIVFLKGMAERFGELSFGVIYVKTDMPVDARELLGFRIRSKEIMEMAFNFATHARSIVEELQTHAQNVTYLVIEDVLASGNLRRNKEFSLSYAAAVGEETAGLFLAKQILSNTLHSIVKDELDRAERNLYFNMTIVVASVAALILCLIFSVISRATSHRQMETGSREIIYHHF